MDDPGELLHELDLVWRQTADAVRRRGGTVDEVVVGPPATDEDIGLRLEWLGPTPRGIRDLLEVAGAATFSWTLEESPGPTWGSCEWSPALIASAEETRRSWVAEVFPNADDAYDRVWHDKYGILTVGNADCIAVDLKEPREPVIYLSHDDGEGHGNRLGNSVIDFFRRWTMLGCIGPEDWELKPFMSSGILDPASSTAQAWRSWLRGSDQSEIR